MLIEATVDPSGIDETANPPMVDGPYRVRNSSGSAEVALVASLTP